MSLSGYRIIEGFFLLFHFIDISNIRAQLFVSHNEIVNDLFLNFDHRFDRKIRCENKNFFFTLLEWKLYNFKCRKLLSFQLLWQIILIDLKPSESCIVTKNFFGMPFLRFWIVDGEILETLS